MQVLGQAFRYRGKARRSPGLGLGGSSSQPSLGEVLGSSGAWWCSPVPQHSGWRQEDQGFRPVLGYGELRAAWAT